MKKIVIVLTVLMIASVSVAQTMTPQQERQFFQKAYEAISTYANSAKLQDVNNVDDFLGLFENANIQICNDLMSLSYERTLSVREYVKLLNEETDPVMNDVTIWNVQKSGEVMRDNGVWLMSVTFNKNISFLDQCNTFFDSKRFYGDYKLRMTLVWNGRSETCHIRNLEVVDELPDFPREFKVLNKNDERDNNIDIKGTFLKDIFSNEQVIILPGDVLRYRGVLVQLKKDPRSTCDNWVIADYQDRTWRVRIGGAYALNGFNVLGTDDKKITTANNGDVAFNVELGYVFPSTKHLRFGIFAGVGISNNSLTMKLAPNDILEYKVDDDHREIADEDCDTYIRQYEFIGEKCIIQDLKSSDITVPVYLDMEYEFNSIFSVYSDLGIKIQTSKGTMTTTISEYKTWGKYNGYDGLEIGKDEDVSLNDFGIHNTVGFDEEDIEKKMTIDGLFGMGLRVNISKFIAIDAGVQYQAGGNSWEYKGNQDDYFSYTLNGGDKVNLLRKAKNINHKSWKASASLLFKF